MIDWSDWPQLVCSECGGEFRLSERNTRRWLNGECQGSPTCPECRALRSVGPPTQEDFDYWLAMPPEQLDSLLRSVSLLRA
jgi:hypothetical protein